jgi:hypothetical protein
MPPPPKVLARVSEPERLEIVANVVADTSSAKWRENVRRRKRTIALGQGTVHGADSLLASRGIDDLPAGADPAVS